MDIKAAIEEICNGLEQTMLDYAWVEDEQIRKMIMHPISAGGKRIRPALALLACEAVGGDVKKIMPAAASVELLHTFTLVHDDIMDKDSQRRGKPTVHSLWGDDIGILVGDALYSSAFSAISDLRKKGLDDSRVLDCIEALIEANESVHQGQLMDMIFESKERVGEREYLDMIGKKTGALIEASVRIGCIAGGGSKKQINGFRTYGMNCGLGFQIRDDILDLVAKPKDFGKPVGSDIRSGKKTIMVIHALKNSGQEKLSELESILGNQKATDEEVQKALDIMNDAGSIDYASAMLEELIKEARSCLDVIGDSKAKDNLLSIADYILERKT